MKAFQSIGGCDKVACYRPFYSDSLYINSLIVQLKRNCCGVQCGSKEIPGLLFVDDTTLLGEDADGLTKALGILECWCQEWGIEVNSAKSGVMHFRGRGMSREKTVFTVHDQPIP